MPLKITYFTNAGGFGVEDPTPEELQSWSDLVASELLERFPSELFPGVEVAINLSDNNLANRIEIEGKFDIELDVDERELCTWIGTYVWELWCSGKRAHGQFVALDDDKLLFLAKKIKADYLNPEGNGINQDEAFALAEMVSKWLNNE